MVKKFPARITFKFFSRLDYSILSFKAYQLFSLEINKKHKKKLEYIFPCKHEWNRQIEFVQEDYQQEKFTTSRVRI